MKKIYNTPDLSFTYVDTVKDVLQMSAGGDAEKVEQVAFADWLPPNP